MLKINKILTIIITTILLITIISPYSNTVFADSKSIDETIQGARDFVTGGEGEETISETLAMENISFLYNGFLAVGLVILVIWGLVIGIKFMTSAANGKAEIKESLIPYSVGAVIILGSYGIWRLVVLILNNF